MYALMLPMETKEEHKEDTLPMAKLGDREKELQKRLGAKDEPTVK